MVVRVDQENCPTRGATLIVRKHDKQGPGRSVTAYWADGRVFAFQYDVPYGTSRWEALYFLNGERIAEEEVVEAGYVTALENECGSRMQAALRVMLASLKVGELVDPLSRRFGVDPEELRVAARGCAGSFLAAIFAHRVERPGGWSEHTLMSGLPRPSIRKCWDEVFYLVGAWPDEDAWFGEVPDEVLDADGKDPRVQTIVSEFVQWHVIDDNASGLIG